MIVTAMLGIMGLVTLWDTYGPIRRRFRFRENCVGGRIRDDVSVMVELMDKAVERVMQ